MKVYSTIKTLQDSLDLYRQKGRSIGFVPTMGALHEGHLSLVRQSKNDNDLSVASIFVNPTQFNDTNDLANYPRTFNKDCDLLKKEGCNIVFAPEVQEMYPAPDTRIFNFGLMGEVMEGKHRPGHFNGVAQIVSKLFDAVMPNTAYFGRKDFQQLAIIRKLVAELEYPIKIIGCPIIRENDGLAMSSRNALLTSKYRNAAPEIYTALIRAREIALKTPVAEIHKMVKKHIEMNGILQLEYFQMVNTNTLEEISEIIPGIKVTGCIAVYAGNVRLIDNIDIIS